MASAVLRLAREAAWAPLGVLLLLVLGVMAGASDEYYWVLHFAGGAAIAFFIDRALDQFQAVLGELRAAARSLLVLGLACTVALFWEIGQFLLDKVLGLRVQGDLTDTMIDLTLGVAGALAGLALMRMR
jgi:hypothetical protein